MRDLLFNLSLAFAVLMVLALILITSDEQKQVERPAEYLLTMTWDDQVDADVDMHLLFNDDLWVYYYTDEKQHVFLERDDLGIINDRYYDELGQTHITYLNREVITVREKIDGLYVVNGHMFNANKTELPLEIHLELLQLNPYKIIANHTITLSHNKQEQTFFSFLVDGHEVVEVNYDDYIPIVTRRRGVPGMGSTRIP